MTLLVADPAELEAAFYQLYRGYFDTAEATRRWSLSDDIPWNQCRGDLPAELVEVVETLCAQKMKVVDQVACMMPMVRASHGRAWFLACWGYEELRHGLVLSDWLLASGQRNAEQMTALEDAVLIPQWQPPFQTRAGLLAHGLVQEAISALCYRNLLERVGAPLGDPALVRLLEWILADERAHYDFYLECVQLFLKHDGAAMLAQLRAALNHPALPVLGTLADGPRRGDTLARLGIFHDDLLEQKVRQPLRDALELKRSELDASAPSRLAGVSG